MNPLLFAVARGEHVPVEGSDLIAEAAAEGMLGLVARAATNPNRELQMKAAAIEAHAVAMNAELTRIARTFQERSLRLLAFKGAVLSHQLYGAAGLRSFSDLDVLVSPDDADAAEELLKVLGYRELEPLGKAERAINRRFAGEFLFLNDRNGVLVDLHTKFSNEQFPLRLDFEQVWSRRSEVEGIPTLGPSDLVVVTCSHAAKHLWHRLEFFAQIAALTRLGIEWDEVDRIAVESRAARQLGLSFLLAQERLGVEVPPIPHCLARALPELARATRLVAARHDATGRDLFTLLDRRRDALRSFALAIFVPTHTDWHGSSLPAFAQWLLRPFRLMLRRLSP